MSAPYTLDISLSQVTTDLRQILRHAQEEAAHRHGIYVDVEHLMLGLLTHDSGPAHDLLVQQGADLNSLYEQVAGAIGVKRAEPAPLKDFTRAARDVMDGAARQASALGQSAISGGHLLLALLEAPEDAVRAALGPLNLAPDAVRDYLRAHPGTPAAAPVRSARRPASEASPAAERPEIVLVPTRRKPKQQAGPRARRGNWPLILGALALFIAYLIYTLPGSSIATFALVLIGWVFSVTLHEFAHAVVAYWGGDHTVKDKGYLSFNPLKYTHPMLSIGMPLLFLALGGIGLPGGAVYIEQHRLRSKGWRMAVSAAGPLMNMLLALLLAAPFALGLVDVRAVVWRGENLTIWSAVAFLAMLQITAVIFNLLPIPPLDGYGIIEPLLDQRTAYTLRQFAGYGFFLIFILLWFVEPANQAFWQMVFDTTNSLKIPIELIARGFDNFMFWQQPPR